MEDGLATVTLRPLHGIDCARSRRAHRGCIRKESGATAEPDHGCRLGRLCEWPHPHACEADFYVRRYNDAVYKRRSNTRNGGDGEEDDKDGYSE